MRPSAAILMKISKSPMHVLPELLLVLTLSPLPLQVGLRNTEPALPVYIVNISFFFLLFWCGAAAEPPLHFHLLHMGLP
jgi:hypothetical protein